MTRTIIFADAPGQPRLRVEVSRDHARGLQHRPWLHPDHGMLFSWPTAEVRTLWTRDTYIPLDVIFVDLYGQIIGVLEDVPPMSDAPLTSPGPVLHVIEVNAGNRRRLRIACVTCESSLLPSEAEPLARSRTRRRWPR